MMRDATVDLVPRVALLRNALAAAGHSYRDMADGTALSLLRRTGGDPDKACRLAISLRVPGTHGIPGCEQIATSPPPRLARRGPVQAAGDPDLESRVQAVQGLLGARNIHLPDTQVASLVELAQALPNAMVARDRHLVRCTPTVIALVAADLHQRRAGGGWIPALLLFQALYPQVSINGANLGFRSEQQYWHAVRDLLPADFAARFSALQHG